MESRRERAGISVIGKPAKRRARRSTTTDAPFEVTPPGLYHWGLCRRHVWALCASLEGVRCDPRPVKVFLQHVTIPARRDRRNYATSLIHEEVVNESTLYTE